MYKYIISIDLGGTNTKLAIFDQRLKIKARKSFSTKDFSSNRHSLISEIATQSQALLKSLSIKHKQVIGLGLGVPGPVDFMKGKVHYLPNIPKWRNTPIRDILSCRMRYRVFVDNDANAMALAETTCGAARGARNAICLTLGTGVGGGLILDGKIFRGANFCAGEIGHMPIKSAGRSCTCGGYGCLDAYVGNAAVLAQAKKAFNTNNITCERLSRLAKKNNKRALSIFNNFATTIGISLAGLVNALNPEVIVIGGGLSNAGAFVFRKIKQTIDARAMPIQAKSVKVKRALLGNDAGLLGAALLVRENIKVPSR